MAWDGTIFQMREIIKIIGYSIKLKRYYLAVAFLVIVIASLNLATPFLTKSIVDLLVANIQGQSINTGLLSALVLLILVSDVIITLLDNLNGYIGDQLSAKLHTLLAQRYYDHLLKLPIGYYDNEVTGRITSRLDRSIVTISQLMKSMTNGFIQFFLTAAVTLAAIAYYSWPIAVFLALLFPLYIWLTHLSSKSWQIHQEHINKDTDYARGRYLEAIAQIRVVKSFTQEALESRIFARSRSAVEGRTKQQSKGWHTYDIARRLVLNVVFFGIFAYIAWATYRGQFSLGEMTLLLSLSNQAKWPLFGSSFIIDSLQQAQAGSRDFFEVMAIKPAILDAPGAKTLRVRDGLVEYQNVDFAYSGADQVLNDITFTAESGSKVALVGESGEGKTTITNLLLRFYEPTHGSIMIDGKDIATVTQDSLRRNIGVVFQDPALFSGSVRDNIRYGVPKATLTQVTEAAKAANAHSFIQKLPHGYDTEIGERGVKLSGGQKQRIAIARAILKNPPILILDEATSSLDSKAEREVQEALEGLMEGRTTIIIAHRLSTIASVDKVIGIKGGRIAEMGSPSVLARQKGIYSELLDLQKPTKANKAKLKRFDIAGV